MTSTFARRSLLGATALLPFATRLETTVQAAESDPVRRSRTLSPGMNLPWWLWFSVPPWDPTLMDTAYPPAKLQSYRDLGINGVRLPIDYFLISSVQDRAVIDEKMFARLTSVIDQLLELGFSVIVDIHNAVETEDGLDTSDRIEQDPEFRRKFNAFWNAFASRLSGYDPERVLFEFLNEPIFTTDPSIWTEQIAPGLIRAIRAAAPKHTIIASGPQWTDSQGTALMRPDLIDDANVLYNVHFYEPFPFTHQGAFWVGAPWNELHDVPYPSDPAAISELIDRFEWSDDAAAALRQYGDERWDGNALGRYLDTATDWAAKFDVPLIVTEFGAYLEHAPLQDDARFMVQARELFESRGLPWMVWSDRGGFGFEREDGTFIIEMVEALGLKLGE